ncbi:hypothetical protein DSO57_1038217, partial [Entomophthora muscae]
EHYPLAQQYSVLSHLMLLLMPGFLKYNPIFHFMPILMEQEHFSIICLLGGIEMYQVFDSSAALVQGNLELGAYYLQTLSTCYVLVTYCSWWGRDA